MILKTVSPKEAALLLGIHVSAVYQLIEKSPDVS